ncbi:MAG: endonuclease [Deltaproteobacteria bacterium]|nr:MAG: endonuclease [Deltaproteobacteria bacterium]
MPLRIVSYNVRYFGHALRGLASTRGGKRGVAEALAQLEPAADIVCLQEVETISLRSSLVFRRAHQQETQLESFMGELEHSFEKRPPPFPYDAFYFRAHVNRIGNTPLQTMGLAILVHRYRIQIDAHNCEAPHNITYHHVLRWRDRKQTRICAHMRLKGPGGRVFHIFNTHLSLPTPFASSFWTNREKMGFGINQLQEAKTLISFIRRHAANDPFIVCGDFNSPPASPVYRYLTEDAGLLGVQQEMGQTDGSPRAFPTAGFMNLRMHLDHMFSSKSVRWIDLEGTRPYGDKASPFWGKSDHVPLIGRFDP